MKKSLAWLIIICMVGTLFPSTAFASYSDVEQHWGKASIEKWSDMGIIQGSNGAFRPNDSITRGEMAVIIDRVMKYQTKSSKNFSDLGQVFYTDAILKANAAGVIQGDGATVRPNDKITREEAVVMLGRALGLSESVTINKTFSDSSKISSWAAAYVNAMVNVGYVNGSNGSFNPKSNITRAEAITILDNSIKKLFNESKEYTGDISGMAIINTPGVVLKDMKIKGDLIISEGVGSGDVTLDSVTVLGKTIIRGGGANSIHIIGNSKISSIIMQKTDDGAVRIVTSDGAIVDAVIIDDGNDDIILTGSFDNVTVATDVTVKAVNAVIKNIEINSENADLNVDKDSNITEINVSATAKNGSITIFGKVDTLNIDAKITINNKGTITKATIIEGVTLNGNKPVTVITPTTTPSTSNSGSHGSSDASITAKDFNSYTTTLAIDYSQATQLPLTGYFTKVVGTNRAVKVYIPENASIRAKFTVIAVPEGVNTYSFLKNEGWINRADENGECLFALEPGANGWGTQTEENDYMINSMKFLASGTNDNKISVFSNYGAFYLVGYNTGCAPLESWSANNPIFVNSQVYINGTSVGQEYLDTVGTKKYNGKNTGGYDPGQDDDDFIQTLKDLGYDGTFMSQSEVPVPTWFIGYDNDSYSVTYWKKANDVVNTPDGDVFRQDINSDAWQTQYANESILKNNPNAEYGMSQVKVSQSVNLSAENIFKFHSNYIRYTTTFAYSNHLEYRLDYGKMTVELQKKASLATVTSEVYNKPNGETGSYDFYAQADTKVKAYDGKTGTVISGIAALTDYNNDGKKDPRDYIAYVPDSAKEIWGDKGAPVVLVHPGMTQTASVFMDASMWWQVANDEGCVFIIVGEAYSSATGVSYQSDSAEFAYMLENIISSKISDYAKLDLTRIYGSGHSLGCRTIQDLSMSNPDLIAAVSSTSFPPSTTERTGKMMPNYFIHGQSDLPFELPDLWGNTGLQDWANYFFEANGLKTDINSYDSSNTSGRFHTYVWNNSQDIPMVKYGYTVAREHNCMPQEFTMGWDFLEHYSFEKDANGNVIARYYSPSGFKNDDKIQIISVEEELKAVNFDDVSTPVVDFTKANKLPLTGYFEKDFNVGGIDRTAKVYIPKNTPVRTYFTLIAVPNGVDTEKFLLDSGWKALADKRAEGLFILESSQDGWGDFTEEQAYLTAAINFLGANSYFSIFGEHYLVGYDYGAPVLEAWAAANPLKVISQAYVNSKALTDDYLNRFGEMEFGGANGSYGVIEFPDGFEKIKYNEVVLPTWYINPDSGYTDSLDYWRSANDCTDSLTTDAKFGEVYEQKAEYDRWMTSHSGSISKVAVLNDTEFNIMNTEATNKIYEFLSYYTRYENAIAYGNQLAVRADYEELGTEIRTMTVSGELREYMVYVPESAQTKWGDEAPAVFVFPGNSQTDRVFLDATQWWQVAQDEGFILVIVCEQNNISAPTTVSHKNTNQFYKQLKEVILSEYKADPTRIYATGQSAGSMVSQSLAIAVPEYFAAIASTSGASAPSADGTVNIDGVSHNASNKMIPNYFMYGAGDLTSIIGNLWDSTQNSLDSWAAYHLGVNGFALGEYSNNVATGWNDRFKTWTWSKEIEEEDVPIVKVTQNLYRSHNCISEEMPMLWDFLKHYSYVVDENNNVTRYYSPSGFVEDDKILIGETETELIKLTAITDMRLLGQKLAAVAIEYKDIVDPNKLSELSYEIKDLDSTGEAMAVAEISKVYTNDAPEIREDATSVPGKYVIVEIADSSKVGIMMTNYVYNDENGSKKTQAYWLKKDVNTTVKQLTDILGLDGELLSKASTEEMQMTEKTVQLKYDEFKDLLTIPSSSGIDNIMVKYRLPKNYDPSKKYPIIMSLTGQGTSFWQVNGEDNFGTSIAIDKSATAWMDEEDMIIVSTHYRSTVPSSMSETYSASDDIIATYEYFIENYSVDTDRVYLTGNSMGTAMSFQVLMKRPDLVTSFICANGAVNPGGSQYLSTRKDELKVELSEVAKEGIAIWFHHGVSDRSINIQRSQTAYQALLELHRENGRSEEWIAENLKFTTYEDADFVVDGIDIGPPIYHSATKLAYQISYNSSWEDSLPDGERGIGISEWVRSKIKQSLHEPELVESVETATPIADGTGTGDTNIGKYVVLGTTGQSPNFATVITGTAILADIESANEVQGVAKWIGVLITTDKKAINLSVKTPNMTEFTELIQSDIDEAVAVGASGNNTFVWWIKAENLTEPNDILIKVTGEDDSTAVTLSISYNPFKE